MTLPPRELLDDIAGDHDQTRGFTPRLIACRAHLLDELLPPGDVLDLGCADGLLTAALARHHRAVTAVDASAIRVERTRAATAGLPVTVVQSYFEELEPGRQFDAVVMACILEHLDDPVALLRRCATWLRPGGVVASIVPHGRSLHRRAGVHMGLLPDLDALGEADDALDHKRTYTLDLLRAEYQAAGLRVTATGGILLKPLPNSKMAQQDPALIDAWEALGRALPDLAAEIYALGTPQGIE
ncbi:MAG TPA: class I SAM-dependent methyltransferase [Kofleriaceae bacterium]|nr:class I SAM-dependent methyltransferase [Kofleriaceae bacterium]